MKITILVDNNTIIDRYFYAEPGLSFFIQDEDKNILLDTGYSDIFIRNAQRMAIDLLDLDFLVISHGHLDHSWGLAPLIRLYTEAMFEKIDLAKPMLIAHPWALLTKTYLSIGEIGSIFSEEKLSRHFNLNLSKKPVWLTERLVFLGEIERTNQFEAREPLGKIVRDGVEEDDYLLDDTALVYRASKGLVVITGCSHSGICNIVEYAKKICKENKVIDIVGGLHLLNPSKEQMQGTLDYMKELQPDELHACHCTDLKSKIALSEVANVKEVGVGLTLGYE